MLDQLRVWLSEWAGQHNAAMGELSLHIRVSEIRDHSVAKERLPYKRFLVGTIFWSVAVRGRAGTIELFRIPASGFLTGNAETPANLKLRMKLHDREWEVDEQPVTIEDIEMVARALFKDIISMSLRESPAAGKTPVSLDSFTGAVSDLILEKTILSQKLVNAQEAVQSKVTRDIHDVIIADLMTIRRAIKTGQTSFAEIDHRILEVIKSLRSVCEELTPRDIKDWGLSTALANFIDTFGAKNGIKCEFEAKGRLPALTDEVQLHIFRIVQECCNNAARHGSPSKVSLKIDVSLPVLTFCVEDNGSGFEVGVPRKEERSEDGGGTGLGLIAERVALLNYQFPTRFAVDSQPGAGTKTMLTVRFSESKKDDSEAGK